MEQFDANEIIKNLYLGDYDSSVNVEELKQRYTFCRLLPDTQRNITHILSVGHGMEATHNVILSLKSLLKL
jgi:hypothetical protein